MTVDGAASVLSVERREAGIVILRFDRPRSLNALNRSLVSALVATTRALSEDKSVRAVVVTGAGRAFMAGGDVIEMAAMSQSEFEAYIGQIQELTRVMLAAPFPFIAAVGGPAVGGGAEIACVCDVRVASELATFCFPEAAIGFTSTSGVTHLLPTAVGAAWARRLLLGGETLSARQALDIGFVQELVPAGEELHAARDLAMHFVTSDPAAMRETRYLLNRPDAERLEAALLAEQVAASKTFRQTTTKEHLATRLSRDRTEATTR